MSSTFDVSVVMPCYNAQKYLREAIESVLQQSDIKVQLVCVDDGSEDETVSIIQSYGASVELVRGPHCGANAARNAGIQRSTGEYIKFLDSDDVLCPFILGKQVAEARVHRERIGQPVSVYGRAFTLDSSGTLLGLYTVAERRPSDDNLLFILENSPITSCPLHYREAIVKIGGFTVGYPTHHEHDLHFRLAVAGVQFFFQDNVVYYYRQHTSANRITSDPFCKGDPNFWHSYYQTRLEDLKKYFGPNPIPHEFEIVLSRLWWRSGRWCARHNQADVARKCFRSAKELGGVGSIEGGTVYRLLATVIDPLMVESVLKVFRR